MSYAVYFGLDKILEAFEEEATTPYWSLWVKKTKASENTENDEAVSIEKLSRKIEYFEKSGMKEDFIICLHNNQKNTPYTYKDGQDCVKLYCAISAKEPGTSYFNNNQKLGSFGGNDAAVFELMNSMNSRMAAIEASLAEETEEETEEENKTLGAVKEFTEWLPVINGVLSALGINLNPQQPVTSLAGIESETDQELNEALKLLFSKGVKVFHLKKLAQMPQDKITMLLNML